MSLAKDLSIIICTWNNSNRLAITLNSLCQCIVPDDLVWELVLVDNNCTDNTDSVVEMFVDKMPIVYVREVEPGKSKALNLGLKTVSGKLILFADDDVKFSQVWIVAYWSAYTQKGDEFFYGGPIESEFEGKRPDEELLNLAPYSVKGLDWGQSPKMLVKPEIFVGTNWACPANALRKTDGFNLNKNYDLSSGRIKIGEDTEMMSRLKDHGLSPWYLPEAKVIHFVPASKCTLKHIAIRAEASAYGNAKIDEPQGHLINYIPVWMYKRFIKLLWHYILAKIKGNNGYQEYIEWRRIIGTMKSFREQMVAYQKEAFCATIGETKLHKKLE